LICPIDCTALASSINDGSQGLLVALFHLPTIPKGSIQSAVSTDTANDEQLERQQQDQVTLISRHLGEILGGS